MNRRDFLGRSALVAVAGLLARSRVSALAASTAATASTAPAAPAGATFGEFRRLRGDVGIFSGRGGTIGWLAARDALAVVDTQFPDTAGLFLAGLPGRAGRRIDMVFNTHHHFDHTSGNPVFQAVARTIVAQANVPRLQFEAARRAAADPTAAPDLQVDRQVYADATFDQVWRRPLGAETVTAQYHGPAHTGGDAVIWFEQANVVHVGDLVFNRMYPFIDRPAGASVRGWITALEEVVKSYPADAIYVFGHANTRFGVTGGRDDLLVMRDYWSAVLARVEKDVAAGRSRAEVVSLENLPGFVDFHSPPPNRLAANLGAAFDELTQARS